MTVDRTARTHWSRTYPPLLLLAVAVLVAALILPSALNIPNSTPSTVLEYAPVPPEDDSPTPPQGNVSSLGLGSSGTLTAGGQGLPPPPPADRGTGSRPTTKRCIGNPPRQTEDPMSPPCVPFFDGDNFGETYQGVTRDEIRVIIYLDIGCPNSECTTDGPGLFDLDTPQRPACAKTWPANGGDCADLWERIARAYNRYFNERFQTYGRRVHYWIARTGAGSAASRRADAQEHWQRLHPFAVLDQATFNGYNDSYESALAARGVLTFTSETALPNAFFRQNAPLAWGFWPDIEHWVDLYSTYVCTKVKPFKVSHSGFRGVGVANGRDRRYGLFYTTDPGEPGLHLFREMVMQRLTQCGITWAAEGTFAENGFIVDRGDNGAAQTQAVAKFQSENVTTVLYLGGVEGKFTHAADAAKYYPEIVFAGDLDIDNNAAARLQNQNVFRNAWGPTFQVRMDRPEESAGYAAYKAGNAAGQRDEARLANDAYRDHFMLFQAIQVAGPRLTPESVDQGFHAIPSRPSSDPYVAAFFFDPGDYTSVKDSAEAWWDPEGVPQGGADAGCFRMTRGGARFLAGRWPTFDEVFANPNDVCTSFEANRRIRP